MTGRLNLTIQDMLLILQTVPYSFNISKYMKSSDSDYVAQSQSSNKDTKKKKQSKKSASIRLNKKEMIETAQKVFIPEGITITKMQPLTIQQYEQLSAIKDAQEFSLNYKTFLGKVVKVTDGDTLRAIIWLNNNPTKFIFRLGGIDTPQTRKGQAKEFGKKVKQILGGMIEGRVVKIQAGESEKYGRILARVYAFCEGKQICINDFLLQNEMARSYSGKGKTQFTSEDEQEFLESCPYKQWPKAANFPLDKF